MRQRILNEDVEIWAGGACRRMLFMFLRLHHVQAVQVLCMGRKGLDAADVASSSAKKARVDVEAAVDDWMCSKDSTAWHDQLVNQVTSIDLELYEREDEQVSFTFDDQASGGV